MLEHTAGMGICILIQVGAEDQVKSREGREGELGVSLLKRLHSLYCEIEKESGVAQNPYSQMFRANLLSNYRCDPGTIFVCRL